MHLKRFAAMTLLLLAGAGSLLYGSLYHQVAIQVEKEREISIAVPVMTLPPMQEMPMGPPDGSEPWQEPGPMSPPPIPEPSVRFETLMEKYVESEIAPEWVAVWEVTFGGLMRQANGELKRTYIGQPPALCPS